MNGRELLSKFKYTRKLALLLGQVPLCVLSTGLMERYIQYRNKYLIEVRNTSSMKIIPLFLFDELTSLATCYVSFKYQKSGDFWFVCFRICVYVCSAFIKIKTSQNHILIKAEISYSSVGGCTMHNMFSLNVWLTSVPVPMTPRVRRALSSSMFSLVTVNAPTADMVGHWFQCGKHWPSVLVRVCQFAKFGPWSPW